MDGEFRPEVSQVQGPGHESVFCVLVLDLVQDVARFQRKGRNDFPELFFLLSGAGQADVHGAEPHRLPGIHLHPEDVPAVLLFQGCRNLGIVVSERLQRPPDFFGGLSF